MNGVKIVIPSDAAFWHVVESALKELCDTISFLECQPLVEATKELVFNAIEHAYKDEVGPIEIEIKLFDNAIGVDVGDKGEPFDERLLKAVPLDPSKGLNRVTNLVDELRYFNLGLKGKKFSILKYAPHQLKLKEDIPFYSDIHIDLDETDKEALAQKVVVRPFREDDEVWIPKLIYKNYGYTYFKDTFYYPEKILQMERSGKIFSVVAQIDEKIVGHFAMVRLPKSNIAEIGIAVVDPAYKGLGIMKKMFHLLLQKAKKLGLSALYGEAITFHPYSQRANARFGFCTTALMLGDVHQMVRLKGHRYPFKQKRGAVALEYKILKPFTKKIALPNRYRHWIERTYQICHMRYLPKKLGHFNTTKIFHEYNATFNIATIVIEGVGKDFESRFHIEYEQLIAKHPDMVYADINLEEVSHIDHAVEVLRKFGFFYCGVAFLRRHEKDYLRMQCEVSENVEEQEIRCYSDFCKQLHAFILKDKSKKI